jgi:hypothetical protein
MQKEVSECLCSCIPYCRCYYLSNFDGWLPIESWERLAIGWQLERCISLMVKRSKLNNPDKFFLDREKG